jgi:2-polyprenyl-3-methyl-5-hydroxy-6-metoxy-1,4-benzoquinol methylase
MKGMITEEEHDEELRTACPVCGVAIEEAVTESPNYYLCPSCRVVYRKIVPQASPRESWDEQYYSDESVLHYYLRRYSGFQKMVQIMNRLVTERRKWLDIGCGVGALLQIAHEQGWQVSGIEPSRICVEAAQKRMEYAQIIFGTVEEKLAELTGFTVVSFVDVLRHSRHPGMILTRLHSALINRGWVLIREVNADSLRKRRAKEVPGAEVTATRYLQQWNPRALEHALRLAGFKNVYSIPSPTFTETTGDEQSDSAGLQAGMKRLVKRGIWPVSRLINHVSCGRIYLVPNFITLGQK